MFIDSHCHLDGSKFASDRAEVLQRARAAGVETLLLIGNGDSPDDAGCALALAEQADPAGTGSPATPQLFASIGIHPHEARLARPEHYRVMAVLARNPRILAWGEIGLDYYYDHSPREVQRDVFLQQMVLAREAGLPIIIHCRPSNNATDAWDDCLGLIQRHWSGNPRGGILHCFTGQKEHAEEALRLGFMVSFAGNVSYPKALNIRDAARDVPLDRLLIETDSPYLAPVPHRGKRNEPAFVAETARLIAELRGISAEALGGATAANFRRFFRLA